MHLTLTGRFPDNPPGLYLKTWRAVPGADRVTDLSGDYTGATRIREIKNRYLSDIEINSKI